MKQKIAEIEAGIKTGDLERLRTAIGGLCYSSRDFSNGEFDEAVAYVTKEHGLALLEEYNGEPLISTGKDNFVDDDFADAVFELKRNFCQERIDDVKRIGKALYGQSPSPKMEEPDTKPKEQMRSADADTQRKPSHDNTPPKQQISQKEGNRSAAPFVLAGVAAAVIILAIILH